MTQYVKSTSFTSKDTLPPGNALKILKGTEIDVELDNIAIAVNSKADLFSAALTGVPTAPTASAGANNTQIASTAFVTAGISPFTGTILMWPTATPPAGFLICNGQLQNRGGVYAALFAIIGTTFGFGDATNFAMPNYTDRMPVGVGGSFSVNQKGGSFDSSLPSHTHGATSTVNDPSHNHQSNYAVFNAPNLFPGFDGSGDGYKPGATTSSLTGITVSTAINAAGVSPSMTNMTPYIGMYFIIKL